MKTIEELNQKVWYRLLKILYLTIFIFITIITIFIIYEENVSKAIKGYTIVCNYGNKTTFNAKEKGINFSLNEIRADGYLSDITDTNKVYIRSLCEISEDERQKLADNILSGVETNKLFEVIPLYQNTGIDKFIFFSFVGFIVIIIIFEVIRRIFYYVALGKIIPNKK